MVLSDKLVDLISDSDDVRISRTLRTWRIERGVSIYRSASSLLQALQSRDGGSAK